MKSKVIYIDFSQNKRRNKDESFLFKIKNILKNIFNSRENPSDSNNDRKVIYYNKDIS